MHLGSPESSPPVPSIIIYQQCNRKEWGSLTSDCPIAQWLGILTTGLWETPVQILSPLLAERGGLNLGLPHPSECSNYWLRSYTVGATLPAPLSVEWGRCLIDSLKKHLRRLSRLTPGSRFLLMDCYIDIGASLQPGAYLQERVGQSLAQTSLVDISHWLA